MSAGPNKGITLYSFTPEYLYHVYDVEGLTKKAGELGMGPGFEIVGYQTIRGFPTITSQFADWFQQATRRHGFEPSCLGANVDIGIRSNRFLTEDELLDSLSAQILMARRLGFPVARIQYSATPTLLERLAPIAEREDIKIGVEIHAPHSVQHPTVLRLREAYEKIGSPYLGFIPDFGASTTSIPQVFLNGYRRRGVPEATVKRVVGTWQEARVAGKDPFLVRTKLRDRIRDAGGSDYAQSLAWHAFEYFGHQAPEAWGEIMPRVFHVHAKFFEIVDGVEPNVPTTDLVRAFVEGGYSGYMSSEYEGWVWDENPDGMANSFELVRQQQELLAHGLRGVSQGLQGN